jgi:predicted transcriptional regulator
MSLPRSHIKVDLKCNHIIKLVSITSKKSLSYHKNSVNYQYWHLDDLIVMVVTSCLRLDGIDRED